MLLFEREVVGELLGFTLCANPFWDMLLDLYLAKKEGRGIPVWTLCLASHAPLSSAYRHVGAMIDKEMVQFDDGAVKNRRKPLVLAPAMEIRMDLIMDRLAAGMESPRR
ncbi:MarR family transcriptional regulator [Flavisphingomonas formosensis]|uniref:MarR family transcriptional regulator n=1 Tax=Flavisphingomonas formosensis TaxID=861534 RepID=UPI0012FACCBF|nr:MarR family transcriptional regulator [Sphingomonas formosensis]